MLGDGEKPGAESHATFGIETFDRIRKGRQSLLGQIPDGLLTDGTSTPSIQLIPDDGAEHIPQFEPCGFIPITKPGDEGGCEWVHVEHISLFGSVSVRFHEMNKKTTLGEMKMGVSPNTLRRPMWAR